MILTAYAALLLLLLVGLSFLVLLVTVHKRKYFTENPAFSAFQASYFRVYLLALLAEWLQSPYLYELYSSYGFRDTAIAALYACGFASSVVFGTYTGFLADVLGRKKVCMLFCILYSMCCITKFSRSYLVLMIGRMLGGISTSLLFTAFDAWYTNEHTQNHGFPMEWIEATFSKATLYNSLIAIVAGIASNVVVEFTAMGPVAPFLVAIPCLMMAGLLILFTWGENFGKAGRSMRPCCESLIVVLRNPQILLVGCVQSLYESVLYVFVFLWTPTLKPASPPLGVIFSCFMACVMIGGFIFDLLHRRGMQPSLVTVYVVATAALSMAGAAWSSEEYLRVTFVFFLVFELMCGIYFPAMGWVRFRLLPDAYHASIVNWFRLPMNFIAAVTLMVLHDTESSRGISLLLSLCATLLFVCTLLMLHLHYYTFRETARASPSQELLDSEDDMIIVDMP